jgi:hypothetical protein
LPALPGGAYKWTREETTAADAFPGFARGHVEDREGVSMRRAGMLCVVVCMVVAGCDGGGRQVLSLLVTCGSSVAEGSTVRLRLNGNDFNVNLVDVTVDAGTIANLTVDRPELLSLDFTAPTFPPGTLGPKTVVFTVSGSPGGASSSCTVLIHLAPFVTSCTTSYPGGADAAPTTGFHDGAPVVATITGGNFLSDGVMLVEPRGGSFEPLSEIGAADPFTGPGQFRVVSGTTVEMTVPDVFSVGSPTILDGSPNAGPAKLRYLSPFGVLLTEEECFRYVPAFLDFEELRYEVPGSVAGLGDVPGLSVPGKVAIGDVNADGVPDIVVLAQQTKRADGAPEAYLFLADTFGAGIDRDGDGKSPDFAGTFSVQVINHPDMQTLVSEEARGQSILLSNLDGDPQLEIVVPVVDEQGTDPLLLVDIEPTGLVGTLTVVYPTIFPEYTSGIAVGDFDHTSPEPDIAALYGAEAPGDRKLVIFTSNGPFDYDSTVYDIPLPYEDYRPGALGAGDFDGDGDDDLIWGHYDEGDTGLFPEVPAILVARVDADAGDVGPPEEIGNFSGTPVAEIEIFDANGDGRVDALVFIGGETQGDLLGDHLGAGVATFLDPFGLEADAFVETPYRFVNWDRAGNGRGLAQGDFNGDGVTDLATVNDFGEILVMTGRGDGTFAPSGRSWQVVTGETESAGPVQSLDAGDFDGDGLAEIIVGDMSNAPFNLVYWLNASR